MLGFSPRAFSQNVDRLNRRTTIVYSVDDIRRAITLCMNEGRPCNLEMGDNIAVVSGFTLPSGMRSFSLDGGHRFKFVVANDSAFLFRALGAEANKGFPVSINNVEIVVSPGATLTTCFVIEQSSATATVETFDAFAVENVTVVASFVAGKGAVTNVFSHGGFSALGAKVGRILVRNLLTSSVSHILSASDDNTCSWIFSSIDGLLTNGIAGTTTLGAGPATAKYEGTMINVAGQGVTITPGNGSKIAIVSGDVSSYAGNAIGNNTLVRVRTAVSRSLGLFDVDVDAIKVVFPPSAVTLNTAAPTLVPGQASLLRVTHGATASGSVTVSTANVLDGSMIVLVFQSVSGTAVYTDGVGNLQLASTFTPTIGDSLTLIHDAGLWFEVSRSVN